ncbi:MAG: hypothetical protein WC819_01575 [Parcubacteria group bacterium]|jgi:hypothetical protein
MRPDNVLSIGNMTEDGQIIINGSGINTIKLLGSSVPISCRVGETVSFLMISPEKEGMVAIRVYAKSHKDTKNKYALTPEVDFLLNVRRNGEEAFYIDRDNHGMTKRGRLCQISKGILQTTIEGILFLSGVPCKSDEYPPFRIVDGDVMCQYVVGDIEAEMVKEKATTLEAEKSALECLPQVEAEKQELVEKTFTMKKQLDATAGKEIALQERINMLSAELERTTNELDETKVFLWKILSARSWSVKGKLRVLLAKIDPTKSLSAKAKTDLQ